MTKLDEIHIQMKKTAILKAGKAGAVRELVDGLGMDAADAINFVYDQITLTVSEFKQKYFGRA